jgi:hypothetical protein
MKKEEVISFKALFNKATTTIDGSWRISIDLGEHDGDTVMKISALKDKILNIALVASDE